MKRAKHTTVNQEWTADAGLGSGRYLENTVIVMTKNCLLMATHAAKEIDGCREHMQRERLETHLYSM